MSPSEEKNKSSECDSVAEYDTMSISTDNALKVIHSHIDSMQKQLDHEFEKVPVISLSQQQDDEYFLCSNKFWDAWFKKLFAQFISVKVWVLVLITALLIADFITATIFGTLFSIIMGLKGAFQVAEVWHDTKNHSTRSPMDKT